MLRIKISATAYQSGFGSQLYKQVCGLTERERELLESGEAILIYDCGRPSGGGSKRGTRWRYVRMRKIGRRTYLDPCVPDAETLRLIETNDFERVE